MTTNLELRVRATEKVYSLRANVYFAAVSGSIETTELGVRDESLRGLLGQVAVATGKVNSPDAKFANLPMRQRC